MARIRKDNDQRYLLRVEDVEDSRIADSDITNWNTAYGWGDHAGAGYLTSYTETDTLDAVTGRGATTTNAVTVGNLTSTGIDDNASSTALTISSSQIVTGLWNDNGTANTSSQIRKLTQAQYDAIGTKDSNTLYIIVG